MSGIEKTRGAGSVIRTEEPENKTKVTVENEVTLRMSDADSVAETVLEDHDVEIFTKTQELSEILGEFEDLRVQLHDKLENRNKYTAAEVRTFAEESLAKIEEIESKVDKTMKGQPIGVIRALKSLINFFRSLFTAIEKNPSRSDLKALMSFLNEDKKTFSYVVGQLTLLEGFKGEGPSVDEHRALLEQLDAKNADLDKQKAALGEKDALLNEAKDELDAKNAELEKIKRELLAAKEAIEALNAIKEKPVIEEKSEVVVEKDVPSEAPALASASVLPPPPPPPPPMPVAVAPNAPPPPPMPVAVAPNAPPPPPPGVTQKPKAAAPVEPAAPKVIAKEDQKRFAAMDISRFNEALKKGMEERLAELLKEKGVRVDPRVVTKVMNEKLKLLPPPQGNMSENEMRGKMEIKLDTFGDSFFDSIFKQFYEGVPAKPLTAEMGDEIADIIEAMYNFMGPLKDQGIKKLHDDFDDKEKKKAERVKAQPVVKKEPAVKGDPMDAIKAALAKRNKEAAKPEAEASKENVVGDQAKAQADQQQVRQTALARFKK